MIAILSLTLAAAGILCLCRVLHLMQITPPHKNPPAMRVFTVLGVSLVALGFVGMIAACVRTFIG